MGIMYKGLTFDGVNSLNYGIYITGEGVYNAPTRDVELITVAGRNGDFALDKGRFNNISITYNAGTFGQDQTDFAEKISDFRNAILSRVGYKRLEDDYHTDEYRMAVYMDGLEVDPVHYSEAGEFELTFNCKPQRFLKSGEEPQTIGEWGETETDTGSIASFEAESSTGIKSLVANIEPIQSGSGDPSTDNIRPISGWDSVNVTECGKNLLNLPTLAEFKACPLVGNYYSYAIKVKPNTSYYLGVSYTEGYDPSGKYTYVLLTNNPTGNNPWVALAHHSSAVGGAITSSADGWLYLRLNKSDSADVHYPNIYAHAQAQLEQGSTATDYEPYQGETITKSLGRTVYGGTLDLISGVLTVTKAIKNLATDQNGWYLASTTVSGKQRLAVPVSGIKPNTMVLCNAFKSVTGSDTYVGREGVGGDGNPRATFYKADLQTVADWKTFATANNLVIVYELATPTTYQLTAEQIQTLLGTNNIWADSGEVSVEFGADPNILVNPTLFESQPLLLVDGYGTIDIEEQEVSVSGDPIGKVNLVNSGTLQSDVVNCTFTIANAEKLNTGDTITVGVGTTTERVEVTADWIARYKFDSISLTPATSQPTTTGTATLLSDGAGFTYNLDIPIQTFAYGTPLIRHYYMNLEVVDTLDGETTHSTSWAHFSVTYDGARKIIFKNWGSIFTLHTTVSYTISVGATTADSTKLISNGVYIDCEIGEAYKIIDGNIVSVNSKVTLPARLPKLKAGDNEITYDNTITSLKIYPRWWKI